MSPTPDPLAASSSDAALVTSRTDSLAMPLLAVVIATLLFVLDAAMALGIAAAVAYGVVVWVARLTNRELWVWWAAGLSTLLTLLGYRFSPPGPDDTVALANRGLAIVVIWLIAVLCVHNLRLLAHHERIQHSLRDAEARARLLLESTGEAIYGIDLEGGCTFANPACVRMLGYQSEAELLGRNMHEVCHHRRADGSTYPEAECRIYQAAKEGVEVHVDDEVLWRQDGSSFFVEYWSQPLRRDGAVVGAVVTFIDITRRKDAEEALRQSEQFLRHTLDSLFLFVGVLDPEGRLIEANRLALESADLEPEDVLGRPFEETYWWCYDREVQKQLRIAIDRGREGETSRYDVSVRVGEDQLIEIDFQLVPMFDERGAVTHLIPSGSDITERNRAVRALKASEERQALLLTLLEGERETDDDRAMMSEAARAVGEHLQAHRVGFFELSEQRDSILFLEGWSDGTLPLLSDSLPVEGLGSGYLARVLQGETLGIGDAQASELTHDSFFGEIGTRSLIGAPILRHGQWVAGLYVNHAEPREWSEGEIGLVRKVADQVWDAVERARARTALRVSEERLRSAAAAAGFGTYDLWPQEGRVIWSEELEELLQLDQDSLRSPDALMARVHPEDKPAFLAEAERIREGRGPRERQVEYRVVMSDGGVRWFNDTGQAFYSETGGRRELVRLIGTIQDVTARKALEAERRQAARELAEANRRKDEFLATMAHELRNPLAPIRTGLEILKRAGNEPQLAASTREMMERQTRLMVRLVDDLLDVSRITRGMLRLRKSRTALADIVGDAVDASRPLIDEKDHHLRVDLPRQPVELFADASRLSQVLSNLLNNAAKYTPTGGSITLSASLQDGEVEISVQDDGVGIPEEMQERVFDLFTQIPPTEEMVESGLGIGLTLVKSLVEMHGGRVQLRRSIAAEGSDFRVTLPSHARGGEAGDTGSAVGSAITARPEGGAPAASSSSDASQPRGLKILVVDDNEESVQTLELLLELRGHEVRTASDGLEAVQVAGDFEPQVVLMDIGMPRLNGYQAAQAIREQSWGAGMTLVALTGWGQAEDKQRAHEAGFDHHFTKPVEPKALESLLRAIAAEGDGCSAPAQPGQSSAAPASGAAPAPDTSEPH